MPPIKSAFTIRYPSRVSELVLDVGISEPCHSSTNVIQPQISVEAIWDTGATISVISEKVVQNLGLNSINERDVQTANGDRRAKVYLVNVHLPNKVIFIAWEVIEGDCPGCDVLIGMDIIGCGDFAVTHKSGTTCMSFQVPSGHDTDYVG